MRTVLILNPTSGISTVTEKQMSVEDTEKAILQGLQAWGMEPESLTRPPKKLAKDWLHEPLPNRVNWSLPLVVMAKFMPLRMG